MARKPNYSFEKRQKEILKQKKKEEKRQRKLEKHQSPEGETNDLAPQDDEQ